MISIKLTFFSNVFPVSIFSLIKINNCGYFCSYFWNKLWINVFLTSKGTWAFFLHWWPVLEGSNRFVVLINNILFVHVIWILKEGSAFNFSFDVWEIYMYIFPFCPCLSPLVPVCPCLSLLVPTCPCLSLSALVCLMLFHIFPIAKKCF